MFTFIISTILGIAGIIPPEHFDLWRDIMIVELVLDFPVMIIAGLIINKIRKETK